MTSGWFPCSLSSRALRYRRIQSSPVRLLSHYIHAVSLLIVTPPSSNPTPACSRIYSPYYGYTGIQVVEPDGIKTPPSAHFRSAGILEIVGSPTHKKRELIPGASFEMLVLESVFFSPVCRASICASYLNLQLLMEARNPRSVQQTSNTLPRYVALSPAHPFSETRPA